MMKMVVIKETDLHDPEKLQRLNDAIRELYDEHYIFDLSTVVGHTLVLFFEETEKDYQPLGELWKLKLSE